MEIEFDPAKDRANIAKHGVSLGRAAELDLRAVERDDRRRYGEIRFRAYGLLDDKPYCLAFTMRGDTTRVVSLRRMHMDEFNEHVADT